METKTIRDYTCDLARYREFVLKLAGRPQKMAISNDILFWTENKAQELMCFPVRGDDTASVAPVFSHGTRSREAFEERQKEEVLLRERMRNPLLGISSFNVRKTDNAVFFVNDNQLFVYYTAGPRAGLPPLDVFSFADCSILADDKPCLYLTHVEDNEDLTDIVFYHNDNLYSMSIMEHLDNESEPLSATITAITHIGDEFHQCGVADYIIQEEFSRFSGHCENRDYVMFSYTDTSMVPTVTLLREKGVEHMPYPRVGDKNAKAVIVVFDRSKKKFYYLPEYIIRQSISFYPEYIPRFGFKNKNTIYVEVLSRKQEECATLSYPISALPEITEEDLRLLHDSENSDPPNPKKGFPPLHVEMEQCIPWAWVEIIPKVPIHFGKRFDIAVRHAVETDGAYFHLYVRPAAGSASSWKPLTMGGWNVNPSSVLVKGDHVYFIANAGCRLQQNLFTLKVPENLYDDFEALDETEIEAVSQEGDFVFSFIVADDFVFYCGSNSAEIACIRRVPLADRTSDSYFTLQSPTRSLSKFLSSLGLPTSSSLFIVQPIIVTCKNSRGVPISGYVFIPDTAARNAEKGMPLILNVYGGPHVQRVYENNFEDFCVPLVQCLVRQGFVVAVVDNQMSVANGLRDMSVCKKNIGHFETDDYVCFVKELCHSPMKLGLPESFAVDPARVGIYGWSYGGYAVLLAMSQAADVFKLGFSGAPIGDWTLYDTGYTERYLGELHDAETGECPSQAYYSSSIKNFASRFPEESDRLYIAHGSLDENVHFYHSLHVMSALTAHMKPYSAIVYADERHCLFQKKESKFHHEGMLIKTFVEKL